jgi:hypothetical protein
MSYVAIINVPGYLPDSMDEPATFETAREAWDYLASERKRSEDDTYTEGDGGYSGTLRELQSLAQYDANQEDSLLAGTVYGPTPGYEGDHDLGLAYSVEIAEGE